MKVTAKLDNLERSILADMHETAKVFNLDDTIEGESLSDYVRRQVAKIKAERDALKKAISEGTRLDYVVRSYDAMASALIAERDTALAKLAAFSSGYVDSKQHNAMAKKLAEVQAERDALKAKLATINHIAMSLFVRTTSSEVTDETAEIGRLSRPDGI